MCECMYINKSMSYYCEYYSCGFNLSRIYAVVCVCVFMCMDGCVGLLGFIAGFFTCGWTKI